MDAMRYNDLLLHRSAYGSGGDLFAQFVRFIFPISGREKRTMFMPLSYWNTKKPRYVTLKWKRFESDHFDFYGYPDSQKMLPMVMKYYEEEYERNNRIFGVASKFSKKIPIIFYQTRRDFEQTAIVDGPIPEGLGGLTEILSWRRVTFPFEGELSKFEHVAKHEATHVFQIAKKARKLPLWFIEGTAETNSIYWDSDAEMLIRDMFINGYFLRIPDLWQIEGTWLMYKIGNYICNVIWDEFGEDGFKRIYDNAEKKSFESNLQSSIGLDLQDLDRKVQASLLQRYSHLLRRSDIVDDSKKIEEGRIILASKGRFFLTGGMKGPRNAMYINHLAEDGKITKHEFSEDKTFINESFETFQKGANLTDKFIVYSVKKSAQDELRLIPYTFDSRKKNFKLGEEKRFSWKGIDRIQDAMLMDEKNVAFIGYQEGFSNIYVANLETNQIERITEGQAHHSDLEYSPITKLLYFSREGERDPRYIFYNRDLFSLDLRTRLIKQITNTPKRIEIQPRISEDGKSMLYVATPDLTYDLMMMDLESGQETRLSTMNVGGKSPQWAPNGSIYYNTNVKGAPHIYQYTIPSGKKLALTNKPNFPKSIFNIENGKIGVPTSIKEDKKPDELVLDGLYIHQQKPVIRFKSKNYRAKSVSTLDQTILIKTEEGLPGDTKTKEETLPHYFQMDGQEILSLKSNMVGDEGVPEDVRKWADVKLQGRDIVQSWISQDQKRALLIVNNRLAKDYESFRKKPQVSLVVYDAEKNSVRELEKSPIRSLDQKVQWVAFLQNEQLFIALGEERSGPFEVLIYNLRTNVYRSLGDQVQQFRISHDFGKVVWKDVGHHLADFSKTDGYIVTPLKGLPNRVMAFEFNFKNQPTFFSFDAKAKKWIYSTYIDEEKKLDAKEYVRKDDEMMHKAAISTGGYVSAILSTKEKKKIKQVWIWDTAKNNPKQLDTKEEDYYSLIFRKDFLTLVSGYYDSRPTSEYLWMPSLDKKVVLFDDLQNFNQSDDRLIFEGQKYLTIYDQKNKQSDILDENTLGYSIESSNVYFSSKKGNFFQISKYDLNSKSKKQLTDTEGDKSNPVFDGKDLTYVVSKNGQWNVENKNLVSGHVSSIESAAFNFTDIRKIDQEIEVDAQPKNKDQPRGAEHPVNPEYNTIMQPLAVQNRLKLQNLALAAAYDGDSIRYLISGYADNLFSDKGLFINSMFLGDTKFATVGYSDLNTGNNAVIFYNVRDGIENVGIDLSKNFIFDRYRQLTPYIDFEYQNYSSNSSALNSFIDTTFDSQSYYLTKLGAIYSYDVTIWDRHGPASGSRLYFRTETGWDISNNRSSNTDVNIDVRVYNRILPRFGLAHRLSGGTSQGPIPNIYLIGGNMSFRGVGFDDLVGQNYWVFSEDIRIPLFDFIGAKFFDPVDMVLGFFSRYFDVRAGVYGDVGATWMNGDDTDLKYSVGYFVNVPTSFGLIVRLNQGFIGEKKFGLWFGTNW